jgi:integrase
MMADKTFEQLSAIAVKGAKPGARPRMMADGRGLYLRIETSGSKSWILRYQVAGKRHDHGLGPYPEITLATARERALQRRRMLLEGIDPIEARAAQRRNAAIADAKAMSFKQCAERYVAAHSIGWRNPKHTAQWSASLETRVYSIFGEVPVQIVDTGLVMKALEPIWQTKTETASRVRGRIESILDWAKARGYRSGENPARWKGHLENLLAPRSKVRKIEHHPALPYAELPEFMAELRQQKSVAARALEFLILTAARSGEVLGAQWSEINFAERLWIVPASRMKAGREHRVPLSGPAIAILEEMRAIRHSDYMFPGNRDRRPLGPVALRQTLQRMGRTEITAHGFRSAFADWCSERTSFSSEIREMALAHVVGNKVEAAYRRSDLFQKRRQVMDAWARYCTEPPAAGEVVPFASARYQL